MARFENVTWFCDWCGAVLTEQPGFDDESGIWYCDACGYLNEIKESEIYESDEAWLESESYRRLHEKR